jgi:RimJ/RimL family protein N-acetyltransferase
LIAPPDAVCTARLRLRPPGDEDLEAIAAMHADPEVMVHFERPLDRRATRSFMEGAAGHRAEHGFGFWVVERRSVPGAIGLAGLLVPRFEAHFTPCVEVSWRLARAHWGRGYASEAARACLEFGFEALDLEEIVAFTVPANVRSRGLMERLLMVRDPADDFDHPRLAEGHPLRRHVLYRRRAGAWREGAPG